MGKQPDISIITPTFNRGYCLWKAILSVVRQTYPFWEMVIVDDGSTDDTRKVVKELQYDPRIKYYAIDHGGISRARNIGIEKSKGDIISYLDNDDELAEKFCERMVEVFKKHPNKLYCLPNLNKRKELYNSKRELVTREGEISSWGENVIAEDIYFRKAKVQTNGFSHRREVTSDSSIRWDENIPIAHDLDFLMQIIEKYPKDFIYLKQVLGSYTQRYGLDGVLANSTFEERANDFEYIFKKHQKDKLMQGKEAIFLDLIKEYRDRHEEVKHIPKEKMHTIYFPDFKMEIN